MRFASGRGVLQLDSMARIPNALIPPPHGREWPDEDYGIGERVEAAAVLLGTMYPTQVVKRLMKAYGITQRTAYGDIAAARAFLAGLDRRDHETWFHECIRTLDALRMSPAANDETKLKAVNLIVGMMGLRREPPRAKDDEAPMFDRVE